MLLEQPHYISTGFVSALRRKSFRQFINLPQITLKQVGVQVSGKFQLNLHISRCQTAWFCPTELDPVYVYINKRAAACFLVNPVADCPLKLFLQVPIGARDGIDDCLL